MNKQLLRSFQKLLKNLDLPIKVIIRKIGENIEENSEVPGHLSIETTGKQIYILL